MPIVEDTVTRFKTSDGSFFFSRSEAVIHETRQDLIKHVGPLFRGLEVAEREVLDELLAQGPEIMRWLQPYVQALADLNQKGKTL